LAAVGRPELLEALDARDSHAFQQVASFNDPARGQLYRRRYIENELTRELEPFVDHECRKRGVTDPRERALIRETLAEAEIETYRLRFVRAEGSPFETLRNETVERGRLLGERPQEASWTLRKLADHVLAGRRDDDGWRTKVDYVVELFEAHLGRPKAIVEVTYRDVESFIGLLLRSPTNMTKRFENMSLKEAIEANSRRERPFPTLNPNTVRDGYYAVLRNLFRHAHKRMRVIPSDPTEGLSIAGASKAGGTRGPFMVEELNELFKLPVFAGCASPALPNVAGMHLLNDHRFWAPLLMLFSGARPSEIAQLAVSDVKLGTAKPYISILTEFDPKDSLDKEFVVAAKTANARRNVPIHPQLIRLGFGQYVESLRDKGERRLFPEWKLSSDRRKAYSQASWIRQLNEKLIPKVTSRYPRPTIYSLRHTFKSQMVECDVPLQLQNQILGHAKIGMDKYYFAGGVSMEKLYDAVSCVTYPGLIIDHLGR
jgi:integrase